MWHMFIFCSKTSIFVDFRYDQGYDWYSMLNLFKFVHEKNK